MANTVRSPPNTQFAFSFRLLWSEECFGSRCCFLVCVRFSFNPKGCYTTRSPTNYSPIVVVVNWMVNLPSNIALHSEMLWTKTFFVFVYTASTVVFFLFLSHHSGCPYQQRNGNFFFWTYSKTIYYYLIFFHLNLDIKNFFFFCCCFDLLLISLCVCALRTPSTNVLIYFLS